MITLLSKFNSENKYGKTCLILGLIVFLTLGFSIWTNFSYAVIYKNVFFNWAAYFTTQGSMVTWIWLICCFINFYKPLLFLKNNLFLILVTAYEFFILSFYSIIFIAKINDGTAFEGPILENISNICIHFLSTTLFLLLFLFFCLSNTKKTLNKVKWTKIFYGFIYPAVYMLLLLYIFFTFHISEYGLYTAFWNFPDVKDSSLKFIDGGNWTKLLFIPIWMISLFWFLLLFWFISNYTKKPR